MKKMRKAPAQQHLPSSSSYPVAGEDARAIFKLQSLRQDYEDLVKETEAMKKRLQAGIQNKKDLLAQVKFLRRKYKSMVKTPPQNTIYMPKYQAHPGLYTLKQTSQYQAQQTGLDTLKQSSQSQRIPTKFAVPPQKAVENKSNITRKERSCQREKDSTYPSTSGMPDLNQVTMLTPEEADCQAAWENPVSERSKQHSIGVDHIASDLKLTAACRNAGKGPGRNGKRKISWQDQVALRV